MIKELLDIYYKMELHLDKFHDRKLHIEEGKSYQINGVTQSGKTKLVKNYLLTLKKSSYLYIDCNDVRLNIDELNNLYHLFQYGNDIISEDDLYKISSINKEKNIKKNNNNDINNDSKELEKKIEQYINNSKTHILSKKIRKFILDIKSSIQNNTNKSCLKCKLHGKPIVVLDTNVEDFTEIDVMFIALNPGKDEVTFDKPLVGRAGKLHRKYMYFLPKNTKWLITNIMLCFTSNQKEIGTTENQILNVAANCFQNLKMILEKFPPKIIVPIGVPAMKVFGIQGSIKSNSGQVFEKEIQNNHKIKLIPLVHPSAVIRYHGDLEIAYNNGFKTLYDILNGNLKSTKSINKKNKKNNLKYKFTLNESLKKNLITEDDLTKTDYLFDVIELDSNNILMTFISKNGDKKYMIVDYKIPIFIKTDKNYKNHKMLENPDSVVFVNGYERYKLMKTLKESLNFNKNKIKKGW